MSSPNAMSSVKATTSEPAPLETYRFSPHFIGWCHNCLSLFQYFEPARCSFIYQPETQEGKPSSPETTKVITGFYCPDCEEALAQAQPIFASAGGTGESEGEGEEQTGLAEAEAEEWRYPTDEELEDALEWATERI